MDLAISFVSDLSERNVTAEIPSPINCSTLASNDYYGFGVRLGVYFAWVSSYFANTLLPGEMSGSLDTNTIFLLALLVSLFTGTHMNTLYQIDGLIVLHLSSGFLFSCFSIWGYRTLYYQDGAAKNVRGFGGIGTHCRLALIVAISIYGSWFWYKGVENDLITAQDPQCEQVYTWLFGKWAINGGIRKFYIICTIGTSIYYSTMCLVAAAAIVSSLWRSGWTKWKDELKFRTGFNGRELRIIYNFMRVFSFIWIVFCAIMIELTLNENHVIDTLAQNSPIRSPGQLLPLLIGILSFGRILWLISIEHRKEIIEVLRTETKSKPHRKIYNIRRGLGISMHRIISPLAPVEITKTRTPDVSHSWPRRYLVGWLPWLSVFGFGKRALQDIEGSHSTEMQTAYQEETEVMIEPAESCQQLQSGGEEWLLEHEEAGDIETRVQ